MSMHNTVFSAQLERIFSASGLVTRPQRARLSSEMLEILVYLKSNCNFLENKKIDSSWCYKFIFKRSNDCQSRSRLLLVSVSNQRSRRQPVLVSKKLSGLGLEAVGPDYNTDSS